jgi:hypothetical protein
MYKIEGIPKGHGVRQPAVDLQIWSQNYSRSALQVKIIFHTYC